MAVGCIANFIKKLGTFKLSDDHMRFFRGHTSCEYNLNPTIFRTENNHLVDKEDIIINELSAIYPELFDKCNSTLEKLVIAQHYGIPTRLLDITSNPLVALYFACQKEKRTKKKEIIGNAIVYIFDIPKQDIRYSNDNDVVSFTDYLIFKKSTSNTKDIQENQLCIKAKFVNPRMIKQNGAFILFKNRNDSKQIEITKQINSIEIASNSISRIQQELRTLCISDATLFPELSRFAEELKKGNINL